MKFLTFTVLLVALSRSEGAQDKRGVAAGQQAYTAQQQYTAQAPVPASILYSKVQQPIATKNLVQAAPQAQYYTSQTAAAPATYSLPAQQQFQYQPQAQAVAYAQPAFAKYAAAPAAAPAYAAAPAGKVAAAQLYRPQFSLANDVSSFTYSSPVVTYNNLGVLSQTLGRLANPSGDVQAKAAPAPAVYQPQQAYSTAQPAQRYVAAAPQPQQYLTQASPQAYAAAAQAAQQYQQASQSASQAYSAQSAPQTYTAQSAPQAFYSQVPQFYSAAQQDKQANPGVSYAQ